MKKSAEHGNSERSRARVLDGTAKGSRAKGAITAAAPVAPSRGRAKASQLSPPGLGLDVGLHVGLARLVHEDVHDERGDADGPGPLGEAPVPAGRPVPEVLPHDLLLVGREGLLDLAAGHLVAVLPPDLRLRGHGVDAEACLVLLRGLPEREGRLARSGDGAAQGHFPGRR
eukprot:CAMPEP_0113828800 /NCGR_PEP_ID=MMETSP0328-20130328/5469_1 /TAXON_ID=39455 /ORGANISM="Alexandrium minutum" /LENGTH=170 /DNA_ID=CAMNT_0000796831 /DNA_START=17 /DNA_END=526 /DNA_ORIENTATION=- /assembly_acc=CAM_ASM_000350